VVVFIIARIVLAVGEGGNFPAAMKTAVEYFPKKDRAFATSIVNSGTTIGALLAPLIIPVIALTFGWEMSFIIIGALGFIWMGYWQFLYKRPEENENMNAAELDYIQQDDERTLPSDETVKVKEKPLSVRTCLKFKQTWALIFG